MSEQPLSAELGTLTSPERMALANAAARVWGVYAPRGDWDLSSVRNAVEVEVERILAARVAPVEALAEKWNSTPDYDRTEYDRGRVDQRHDMTTELLEALRFPPAEEADRG